MRRGLSASTSSSVALGLAFLYLPIVILVIYSFNASRLVTVWGGWSTRWYVELLARRGDARGRLGHAAHRVPVRDAPRPCSGTLAARRAGARTAVSAAACCSPA